MTSFVPVLGAPSGPGQSTSAAPSAKRKLSGPGTGGAVGGGPSLTSAANRALSRTAPRSGAGRVLDGTSSPQVPLSRGEALSYAPRSGAPLWQPRNYGGYAGGGMMMQAPLQAPAGFNTRSPIGAPKGYGVVQRPMLVQKAPGMPPLNEYR